MNGLINKLCLLYVFCTVIFCGCTYSEETKEKELVLQLEGGEADDKLAENKENESNEAEQEIYVYVCGAVKNEGVYRLPEKSRIFEAIEMAGGFTEDADHTTLNLAREVMDGEQITILTKEQAKAALEAELQNIENIGVVNINTATVSQLTSIAGIGESRAKAIIAYREKNGGFKTIDDIKKVDGIKEGLFSKIKDKISV